MKTPSLETIVVVVKALCVVTIGIGTALSTSLAQYANTGEWPSRIVFFGVVIPSCMVAGGNSLYAFLSGAFRTYTDSIKEETPTVAIPAQAGETPPKP